MALDIETQEVVGVYVGERNRNKAEGLWKSLPPLYRQCAVCYTEVFAAVALKFSQNLGIELWGKKLARLICHTRFNCTLRQRISRLVRKTLSFSKKLENHIGAIWYFVHHYNERVRL